MKKKLLGLCMLCISALSFSQGLEKVIVERYYVSNATDNSFDANLPVGSVTYRVYIDMLPGWKLGAVYGLAATNQEFRFSTTTSFYNPVGAGRYATDIPGVSLKDGLTMIDSWLTLNATALNSSKLVGVLKKDDVSVPIVTVPANVLDNADATAMPALTFRDGNMSVTATPPALSPLDIDDVPAVSDVFADGSTGNVFSSLNTPTGNGVLVGPVAGVEGPNSATNRVLIGQFTTNGVFTYKLNVQLIDPSLNAFKFVCENPTPGDILTSSLQGVRNPVDVAPSISISGPLTGSYRIGAPLTLIANPADDGSIDTVQFMVDGIKVGAPITSAPWQTVWTPSATGSNNITAYVVDDAGQKITSSSVNVTIVNSWPPVAAMVLPVADMTMMLGDDVDLRATASVSLPDLLSTVQFFDGATPISGLIGAAGPFEVLNWTPTTAGVHNITVRAINGAVPAITTISAVRTITVNSNQAPVVTITSPANGFVTFDSIPMNITVTAVDPDGEGIDSVQFFRGTTRIGVATVGPNYTFNWAAPVVGNPINITAVAWDKRSLTAQASVSGVVNDHNIKYNLGTVIGKCADSLFCLPLTVSKPISTVTGYDMTVKFNPAKVQPTGNITIYDGPGTVFSNASLADYETNLGTDSVLISIFMKAGTPNNTFFQGNAGNLVCIEFRKIGGLLSVDTVPITVTSLIESHLSDWNTSIAGPGQYINYQDSLYVGALKFWNTNQAIGYVPGVNLITNISSKSQPSYVIQPDMNGVFKYSVWRGDSIVINRDILSATSVMPIIDNSDANLAKDVLMNLPVAATYSVWAFISLDVNIDGRVTAGDLSQINQRSSFILDEFRQAWNYNNDGSKKVASPSKDWLFVDTNLVNAPVYTRSTTFPNDNGTGFSKYRIPSVPNVLKATFDTTGGCPELDSMTYTGIMVGDANGSYAGIPADGLLKNGTVESSNVQLIFDLAAAQVNNGNIDIPVSVNTPGQGLNFAVKFNNEKLSYSEIITLNNDMDLTANYAADSTLYLISTTYSRKNIAVNRPLFALRFKTNNAKVSGADFMPVAECQKVGTLKANISFTSNIVGTTDVDNMVKVYPNPTSGLLNVEVAETSSIKIVNLSGQVIIESANIGANDVQEYDLSNVASGIYIIEIRTEDFVAQKKVEVIK